MAATLTTDPTLAALRARLAGNPAERPEWDNVACPRCQAAGECPQWCVDADGADEDDEDEPTDCELGDHDLVEVDYDAPVSTQRCRVCGHEQDVDMTGDIEAACAQERERWLYGDER